MGPTWIKKKQNKNKHTKESLRKKMDRMRVMYRKVFEFFSIIFFLRFTETCPSEFVEINTKSVLHDEGYA